MRLESGDPSLAVNGGFDEKKLINRLRRIEGQLRGLERLIDGQADCRQILTQLSAAKAALDQLGITIISGKIKECIDQDDGENQIDELLKKFLKGVAI